MLERARGSGGVNVPDVFPIPGQGIHYNRDEKEKNSKFFVELKKKNIIILYRDENKNVLILCQDEKEE